MSLSKGKLCALITTSVIGLCAETAVADDLGCGYLECNDGCLVFRGDGGATYQFLVPPALWRGAHGVHITGTITTSGCSLCGGSSGCIQSPVITPCYAIDCVFENATDFKQGEVINLNGAGDQLQINSWTQTKTADPAVLPYLRAACSDRGTVVRIAASDHYSPVDAHASPAC